MTRLTTCILLILSLTTASYAAESNKPNIILVMADDQGWGDVGYYGHPILKTPNLDRAAASGLRFDRFYAGAPVCTPTRGSVLTGRNPTRFGCFSWGHSLRPQETTIAEALKTAGYATGHFGKWHVGAVHKESPVNPGNSGFDTWFSSPNYFENNPQFSVAGNVEKFEGESSVVTVDVAMPFIEEHANAKRPFLAVIWFGSPHQPHIAMEEDLQKYAGEDEKAQHFYGEITGIDRAFGKLRARLESLGIRDNTLLWYCSDNGGLPDKAAPSRRGGRGHKGDVFEGGLRVPAFIEWPARIKKARPTNMPCTTSDMYPTLLSLVGVEKQGQLPLDGIDLTDLIDGKIEQRPSPIGFWHYQGGGIGTSSNKILNDIKQAAETGGPLRHPSFAKMDAGTIKPYPEDISPGNSAWLDWPWKLVRLVDRKTKKVSWSLYHLSDDPEETTDVKESHAERYEQMKIQIEAWQQSVIRSLNGKDYE